MPSRRGADGRLSGWPAPVLRLDRVDSTQDLAKRMARDGAPEWSLILAGEQTSGRGRLGRRWASPPGGLYLSIILRPRLPPAGLGELNLAAARAAARTIVARTGLRARVKLPNDVLASPAPPNSGEYGFRKVCGILLESSGDERRTDWLVLGVGLNVNNRPPSLSKPPQAASLMELAGRSFDIESLLEGLLQELRRAPTDLGGGPPSSEPWTRHFLASSLGHTSSP